MERCWPDCQSDECKCTDGEDVRTGERGKGRWQDERPRKSRMAVGRLRGTDVRRTSQWQEMAACTEGSKRGLTDTPSLSASAMVGATVRGPPLGRALPPRDEMGRGTKPGLGLPSARRAVTLKVQGLGLSQGFFLPSLLPPRPSVLSPVLSSCFRALLDIIISRPHIISR